MNTSQHIHKNLKCTGPTFGLVYTSGQTLPFSIGVITMRSSYGTFFHSNVTCKDLTQASEVKESTLRHGEQLSQEHHEGDGGEDHRENHQDLHRLKPL